MLRYLPPTIGIVALVACGVLHGLWTDRWAHAADVSGSASKLQSLPLSVGDWRGEDLDGDTRGLGPIAGFLQRRYVNDRTGAVVTIALVSGRPGPVCIHTPDVCYAASGYETGAWTKYAMKAEGAAPGGEFKTAQFTKKKATDQTNIRIFWSWSANGSWQVPENPRLTFARQPVLFKLYVLRETAPAEATQLDDDPCVELLRLLLPEMQRTFFAA